MVLPCVLCCAKKNENALSLLRTMKTHEIFFFTLFWLASLLLVTAQFSGVKFLDEVTTSYSPEYKVVHSYQDAQKQAKFQWDSKAYVVSIIFYCGFFVTPCVKITSMALLFFTDGIPSHILKHILRTGRAASRMALAPLIITMPFFMQGSLKIDRPYVPLNVEIRPIPCVGQIIQWCLYVCLVLGFDTLWISYHKGKEPKHPRSVFRACCYGLACGCLFGLCTLPFNRTVNSGYVPEHLMPKGSNILKNSYPQTYFEKLPYIEGVPNWSFHFWSWILLCFILPIIASILNLLNQIIEHPLLEFCTTRTSAFWIYDVRLVACVSRALTEGAQNRYREEVTMKNICQHFQPGNCINSHVIYEAGFYWMVAHIFFFYLDDVRLLSLAFYRNFLKRDSYKLQVNDSFI